MWYGDGVYVKQRPLCGVTITVASLAHASGLSRGHVSSIVNGKRSPGLRALAKIARAIGKDIDSVYKELEAMSATKKRRRASR